MATIKLYMSTNSLTGTAIVTDLRDGDQPTVRLSHTLFHPQGGGQKADAGYIAYDTGARLTTGGGEAYFVDITRDRVPVTGARHAEDGEVDHYIDSIDGLSVGQTVMMIVDPAHRLTNTQFHSAGHLLADAAMRVSPTLRALQGHHWPGQARVEFEGEPDSAGQLLEQLQKTLAMDIADDLPVEICTARDGTRQVLVGRGDRVGCGGTHVASTGDLAGLIVRGVQVKSGKTRIGYDIVS